MLENGFKINECDKCVYVKDTSSGYVILCLYVDDMLIVGSNDKIIRSTKDMLKSKFDMKDMGLADVILGIKIMTAASHNGLCVKSSTLRTRPDLAYAVSRLSRHPAVIEGYSDANWISDIKDSRSLGIYISVVDHNSIRGQQLSNWSISIDYVKSKDNIADPLTKGLSRELVSKSSKGIELKPLKE
ncbi:retrovirus-related pol polyprotein from transposon TNT 1-94 [Tanacetum coccineum]|uniref:Retrovirus-related pol polyprotein from transposon TNT 1-94 n=1 Tax=Tanacetum coccineum TaxID=301880 RepID=A0ABQ5E991_9ASTR